jgi:hypothetical protein
VSLGIRHDFPPLCLLTRTRQSWSFSPSAYIALKNKKNLAHPTRFERVTSSFGGQRSATPARWQAAAALQQLVAKLSCKGVKIFYQDGRGKTFSTSLEVGRNKSWAETTCYKSDICPFVPFGIECASQDRTNPWPTAVGSNGALPSRPSPSPPRAQKPSNNQQSSRELTSIGRRAQCA